MFDQGFKDFSERLFQQMVKGDMLPAKSPKPYLTFGKPLENLAAPFLR